VPIAKQANLVPVTLGNGASTNPNDRAGVTVGVTGGDAGGRIYFDSFSPGNLSTPAVAGQMNLRLPVYKTDKTTVLDAGNPNLQWQFDVDNLSSPPAPAAVPNFAAVFDALRLDGALDGFRDGWDGAFHRASQRVEDRRGRRRTADHRRRRRPAHGECGGPFFPRETSPGIRLAMISDNGNQRGQFCHNPTLLSG